LDRVVRTVDPEIVIIVADLDVEDSGPTRRGRHPDVVLIRPRLKGPTVPWCELAAGRDPKVLVLSASKRWIRDASRRETDVDVVVLTPGGSREHFERHSASEPPAERRSIEELP
jgi:hypothetical protein